MMERALIDALPLPTVVVDGELVEYANPALAALLGYPAEEITGRRYADLVAPVDRDRIAERQRRRLAGEAVPGVYDAVLSGAGGELIPVQIRVSLSGRRAIAQLVDRRDDVGRRELLASLARLGATLQRDLSDAAVHRRVQEGLLVLGIRSAWIEPVPDGLRLRWVEMGPGEDGELLESIMGEPLVGFTRPSIALADQVWRDGAAFADEWSLEVERWFRIPVAEALRAIPDGAYSHAIGVRVDLGGTPTAMLFAVGGWLRMDDLPAFQLFGSQIAASLEAARTVGELSARNADLDALNRLADAAAYAPDFEGFLVRAEEVVRGATGCNAVVVTLVDEARKQIAFVHGGRLDPGIRAALGELPLDHPAASAIVHGGRTLVLHPDDVEPRIGDAMRRAGVGTSASVPLRFRSGILGVLGVDYLGAPRDAAAARVDLLQAMAAHFAAAIESHRLLDDLRRRVAELTLLNDLAVASGVLDPVLLVGNALRRIATTLRCQAGGAHLWQSGRLEPVALLGLTREDLEGAPGGITGGVALLAARRRVPVRGAPPEFEEARRGWFRDRLGVQAQVAVPLLAKEQVVGSIVLGRGSGEPFEEAEIRLLTAVGAQLGMAVENARLFADTQRRIRDLEAVNSLALRMFTTPPGDAARLLEATCREIAEALDAEAAVILRLDDAGKRLVGVAAWGAPLPPEQIILDPERTPLAGEALRNQEPAWAEDVRLEPPDDAPPGAAPPPPLTLLFVPLTSRSATRGLVAIADAPTRRWGEAEVALAYALASEAAMAVENAELYSGERRRVEELSRLNEENARLYEDLRSSYAELARAQEQLIRQERLAALGELAAVVAHEVRNPLGVIFNSLGTLRRLVRAEGDAKTLLEILGEEADRLNQIVGDLLDFARPPTPRVRPEPLDRVLDEAAAAALAHAGGRVALERDVPPDLPPVPMDARLMRQVVLNVMANAVQAMPEGGTLCVRARAEDGAVRLEVADTGCGIPEEVRHRIFEPFFTTRATGTGLGLAVVKRILDDHRATVEVDSAESGGTRFRIRLPLDPPPVENAPPLWSR